MGGLRGTDTNAHNFPMRRVVRKVARSGATFHFKTLTVTPHLMPIIIFSFIYLVSIIECLRLSFFFLQTRLEI